MKISNHELIVQIGASSHIKTQFEPQWRRSLLLVPSIFIWRKTKKIKLLELYFPASSNPRRNPGQCLLPFVSWVRYDPDTVMTIWLKSQKLQLTFFRENTDSLSLHDFCRKSLILWKALWNFLALYERTTNCFSQHRVWTVTSYIRLKSLLFVSLFC